MMEYEIQDIEVNLMYSKYFFPNSYGYLIRLKYLLFLGNNSIARTQKRKLLLPKLFQTESP